MCVFEHPYGKGCRNQGFKKSGRTGRLRRSQIASEFDDLAVHGREGPTELGFRLFFDIVQFFVAAAWGVVDEADIFCAGAFGKADRLLPG